MCHVIARTNVTRAGAAFPPDFTGVDQQERRGPSLARSSTSPAACANGTAYLRHLARRELPADPLTAALGTGSTGTAARDRGGPGPRRRSSAWPGPRTRGEPPQRQMRLRVRTRNPGYQAASRYPTVSGARFIPSAVIALCVSLAGKDLLGILAGVECRDVGPLRDRCTAPDNRHMTFGRTTAGATGTAAVVYGGWVRPRLMR